MTAEDPDDDGDGEDPVERFLREKFRNAGRTYAEAVRAYREGRTVSDLPFDDEGRVKIVCRRYAERRAVELDSAARPPCFQAGHRDCEGCVEDIREGRIETW